MTRMVPLEISVPAQNSLSAWYLASTNKSIHKWYHYFEIYERYFARFRDLPIRLLEIGVSRGGSLMMWSDYFPQGLVVGVDNDGGCSGRTGDRIAIEIGDQSDQEFMARVNDVHGPFDIVLDDGGHRSSQQMASFDVLYPRLKTPGVYMVEDTYESYWPGSVDTISFVDYARSCVDRLYEPYIGRGGAQFEIGLPSLLPTVEVSEFSASTTGVCFHDGVVVFEKNKRPMPVHERR